VNPIPYEKVPNYTWAKVPYMGNKSLKYIQGRPSCQKYHLFMQKITNKPTFFIPEDNTNIQANWIPWGPSAQNIIKKGLAPNLQLNNTGGNYLKALTGSGDPHINITKGYFLPETSGNSKVPSGQNLTQPEPHQGKVKSHQGKLQPHQGKPKPYQCQPKFSIPRGIPEQHHGNKNSLGRQTSHSMNSLNGNSRKKFRRGPTTITEPTNQRRSLSFL
jgi:hypothetical protein